MPLKSTPKDRAWGTRYDTLGPCTPPSPNPIPHSSSPSQNPPTSELASSFSPRTPDLGVYVSQLPKPERSPHHASIFVGRLVLCTFNSAVSYSFPP